MQSDTIVAISTPSGRAGIGVIRISGSDAISIVQALVKKKVAVRTPKLYQVLDDCNQTLDDAIVIFYGAPRSYTGDDLIEMQCHSNPLILNEIVSLCCKKGARPANPGEFTERAFRNGKLSLEKAEAVVDLINSQSMRAVRSAHRSISGSFSKHIDSILVLLKDSLIGLEASIDFSEDTETNYEQIMSEDLRNQKKALTELILAAKRGEKLSTGLQVVLAGKPNVGKSSLLNTLSYSNRAIVSPQPGTTRDTIEVLLELNGSSIKLIDTAGIRKDVGEIEQEGIARTRKAIHFSDLVLYIVDTVEDLKDFNSILSDLDLIKYQSKIITVLNKIDKFDDDLRIINQQEKLQGVSALTGVGISSLIDSIVNFLIPEAEAETEFIARGRHIIALECALEELTNISALLTTANPELLAEHYKASIKHVSKITGEYCTEDLLGDIFSKFCIGK